MQKEDNLIIFATVFLYHFASYKNNSIQYSRNGIYKKTKNHHSISAIRVTGIIMN